MTYPGQQPSGPAPQWGPPQPQQQYVPQGGYTVTPGVHQQPGPGYYGPPRPQLVPTAPNGQPLASFGDRLLAYLIDMAIFVGITLVVMVPAVFAIFLIIGNAVEQSEIDPVTGQLTSEPDPLTVILPILLIYAAIFVISLGASYLYYVEMLYKRASTVGKRAMKLRIIRLDDPTLPLTRGIAMKRWSVAYLVGLIIPFFSYVDGFWQLWDQPYKQCLHDKWAGTVVVKVSS